MSPQVKIFGRDIAALLTIEDPGEVATAVDDPDHLNPARRRSIKDRVAAVTERSKTFPQLGPFLADQWRRAEQSKRLRKLYHEGLSTIRPVVYNPVSNVAQVSPSLRGQTVETHFTCAAATIARVSSTSSFMNTSPSTSSPRSAAARAGVRSSYKVCTSSR